MKTLAEMLKPRKSVFLDTTRDDVLNLSDFAEHNIDAERFFSENFNTQGMKMLFDLAFKRFKGESDTSVIKLTQAMGGGKTHSMLALALLASDEKLRSKVLGKEFNNIGKIKVVTFSGRENADFGIWGSIAEQLGKREMFSGYYSPLKAPGESAWINLLKEDKVLILLDELPPYLENARSITVGNSDLSKVTMAALANLFSALGKKQLSNVCLVFSDLRATYESGSELLQSSFKELEAEANRISMEIAPVALNSDEVYYILKKRLFEDNPVTEGYAMAKNEIAIAFKDAVNTSKRMGFTSYSGESVYKGICDAYPFHPSIKDLYARFKENQNFQQTRGLIRLMRQIVRYFYESDEAKKAYLINVYDVELNNPNIMALFRQIKPSLEEAISHDIAQDSKSIAEIIDGERPEKDNYAQRLAKLILVSSLSTASHALLGLTEPEILGYMSAPNSDMNALKSCLEEIKTQCWYIKTDNRGRLYYQNTKNMVAEMNTLVDSYTNENAKKELRRILTDNFSPKLKICYEKLFVLPAVDEIQLDAENISLVIFEPYPGNKLHPDLQALYDNTSYKNRVMFLSGDRSIMEKLYENSKKLKAIQTIMNGLKDEGVSGTDQQYKEAEVQLDKATQTLFSAIRETFVRLYYPMKDGIDNTEFKLEFKENKFDGEEQIIDALEDAMKYEKYSKDDGFIETLRKKCEARLFTRKEMTFSEITERAATEPVWQWYHHDQLEVLKDVCIKKDKWREKGGYLVKGPFEKDPTNVVITQSNYDFEKEEFIYNVRGIGGRVYYDIGADPTEASNEITENVFVTKEPHIKFICIDPEKERKTGKVVDVVGKADIKFGIRDTLGDRIMQLESNSNYEIRYTTDGSEPKENGGIYTREFSIPNDCKFVRAVALFEGEKISEKDIPIDKSTRFPGENKLDLQAPLIYSMRQRKKLNDTDESYSELETLEKINDVFVRGTGVYIYDKEDEHNYVDCNANIPYAPEDLKNLINFIRETSFKKRDVVINLEYKDIIFTRGEDFKNWIELCKLDLDKLRKQGDIKQ